MKFARFTKKHLERNDAEIKNLAFRDIMNIRKTVPLVTQPNRKSCPICGQVTYSSNGIHPQCAVSQADAPRQARLMAAKKAMAKEKQREK